MVDPCVFTAAITPVELPFGGGEVLQGVTGRHYSLLI